MQIINQSSYLTEDLENLVKFADYCSGLARINNYYGYGRNRNIQEPTSGQHREYWVAFDTLIFKDYSPRTSHQTITVTAHGTASLVVGLIDPAKLAGSPLEMLAAASDGADTFSIPKDTLERWCQRIFGKFHYGAERGIGLAKESTSNVWNDFKLEAKWEKRKRTKKDRLQEKVAQSAGSIKRLEYRLRQKDHEIRSADAQITQCNATILKCTTVKTEMTNRHAAALVEHQALLDKLAKE